MERVDHVWLLGLVAWFSLRVWEVPGSIPGAALVDDAGGRDSRMSFCYVMDTQSNRDTVIQRGQCWKIPPPGIEPGSSAWQAEILTTILQRIWCAALLRRLSKWLIADDIDCDWLQMISTVSRKVGGILVSEGLDFLLIWRQKVETHWGNEK